MASKRYAAAGSESEFQPGSRGRVLRNLLGITRVREMEDAESQVLSVTQTAALKIYGSGHRFTHSDIRRSRSLAEVHAELILIHPFRDGNGRLARLMAMLMASQAGINPLRLSALAGRGRRTYVQAIHAAMSRDYAPLESLFSSAIDGPWRRASSST
jgi:fido (protein-threonine AMPylation protein)